METRGEGLPRSMRQMSLVLRYWSFLRKGGRASNLSSAHSRSPDACRPLDMADTDCKLLSIAFSWRLERRARETVSNAQACLPGRSWPTRLSKQKCGVFRTAY
eukprot:9467274-Pyramimonas_sp.AAC.1